MKRLRMIAGPNGSGKTSLTNYLRSFNELDFGFYINADDLQAKLLSEKQIDFREYKIEVDLDSFKTFYQQHPLYERCEQPVFSIVQNYLTLDGNVPAIGYFAALLADFIRQQMLQSGVTFSFETVMSDPAKIQLLKDAKKEGYRVCLYFVCTVDVAINIQRVADRVRKSGHNVSIEKITSRYDRSLSLLAAAINLSDRVYLFDNSGSQHQLVLEITPEKEVQFKLDILPDWVRKNVLNKL